MSSADKTFALGGIPETMLWTLYNRASEAKRPDTYLNDPECIRLYEVIPYDYAGKFGSPDQSHPMRSRLFDDVIRDWMQRHPEGTVVELGAGLETQFQRCDNGSIQWVCVDLPEAMEIRERFLAPKPRCQYIKTSALDPNWMKQVDSTKPVFISAQGLFMYFKESDVKHLFITIADHFEDVELLFDTIPHWFSRKTLKGFQKTKSYTAPPMPWALNRREAKQILRSWSDKLDTIRFVSYGYYRGMSGVFLKLFSNIPSLQNLLPTIIHIRSNSGR